MSNRHSPKGETLVLPVVLSCLVVLIHLNKMGLGSLAIHCVCICVVCMCVLMQLEDTYLTFEIDSLLAWD